MVDALPVADSLVRTLHVDLTSSHKAKRHRKEAAVASVRVFAAPPWKCRVQCAGPQELQDPSLFHFLTPVGRGIGEEEVRRGFPQTDR
ncbi:hypothetical protein E2C01_015652 [Portunus trituberculatus]|uniref:Uncharacterized protein n=1 Tax=Portunus trituberculatus TaxID=210409 RepID=A0A5B7DM49_PORTR|nr:hypothetical protein [Portunus trituberculatus]